MASLLPFGAPPTITATFNGRGKSKLLVYNVREYGAKGDGSTDDYASIAAAIAAIPAAGGELYFPPGQYNISAALAIPSNVLVRGAGRANTKIFKSGTGYFNITFNGTAPGNVEASNTHCGLQDITIEGNAQTGGGVQCQYTDTFFISNVEISGHNSVALDLNTCQDSYFHQLTMNTNHPATDPNIHIQGSAANNSNMLWFSQVRIEDFYGNAIKIEQGSGNSGSNIGFFFDQLKLETGNVSGDFVSIDAHTQEVHFMSVFLSANSYKAAYSTPCYGIVSSAFGQASYRDIWFHDGIGSQNGALNLTSASGSVSLDGIFYNGNSGVGTVNFNASSAQFFIGQVSTDGSGPNFAGGSNVPATTVNSSAAFTGQPGQDGNLSITAGGSTQAAFMTMYSNTTSFAGLSIWDNIGGNLMSRIGNSGNAGGLNLYTNAGGSGGGSTTRAIGIDYSQVTSFYGLAAHTVGTDTSGIASFNSISFSTTVAKQVDTAHDAMLYIDITTAAALAIAIGPTSGASNTLATSKTYALGVISIRVPKAWYVKLTGTMADVTCNYIPC